MGFPRKLSAMGFLPALLVCGCTIWDVFFKNGKKDVYYDGYKREDVVDYRKEFIPRFLQYLKDPNVVLVVQDEVIYRSNEHNQRYWHVPENKETGEMKNVVLRKKGAGWGIMLSGFVTQDGFVELSDAEMGALNAQRRAKNLPPIKMFYRATAEQQSTNLEQGAANCYSYYLFEYGKSREGWWDSEKMIAHTTDVIAMLEFKYPGKTLVFLFY